MRVCVREEEFVSAHGEYSSDLSSVSPHDKNKLNLSGTALGWHVRRVGQR